MPKPTRNDILLGLAVGVFFGASPFTPTALESSILFGAAAAAAIVAWRVWQRVRHPHADEPPAPRIHVPISAGGALAAFALTATPTAVWLYRDWTGNVWDNAHGMLVPVAIAYMVYKTLRREDDTATESSPWGLAFLGIGLSLMVAESALQTRFLGAIGVVLCLPGLSLVFLGARRTRKLTLPFVLGVFMIPVPVDFATHLYLREITAVSVAPILSQLGIPVLREGTVLVLPNATFLVADECSGFSALYAAVGASIVLAATARALPRRILLLLAAFPLAVLCNVMRVTVLVGLANRFGLGLLDTPFHAASGVATFWAVLVLLFAIADRDGLRESYA